jgi:ABC-type transporter Mla subunit MlaD
MATKAQKIRLGLFLLAATVLGALMFLVFGGRELVDGSRTYRIVVDESVSGLADGSPVKILGVDVGRVSDIVLSPEHTHVIIDLSIPADVPIYSGAIVYIKRTGVTELKYVDIEQRTAGKRVPPGSYLTFRETPLAQLSDNASEIANRTLTLLDKANGLVDEAIGVVRQRDRQIDHTIAQIDRAASEFGNMSVEVRTLVRDNRALVRDTLADLGAASATAASALDRADRAVQRLDDLVADIQGVVRQNGGELRSTLRNLRVASQGLRELGTELRRSPSSLLFSRPAKERKLQ